MYPDVVVLAGGAIGSPLSICKSIRERFQIRTFVICIDSPQLVKIFQKSKFITEVISLNKIDCAEKFYNELKKWYNSINFLEKPVLFSTTDLSCIYVNDLRDRFEDKFILTIPSSDIIDIFSTKGKAEISANRYGLATPNSLVIDSNENIKHVLDGFSFPVIIKPVSNRVNDKLEFKAEICNRESFLKNASDLINNNHHVLCQEYIPGEDTSVWFYIFYRSQAGEIIDYIGIKTLQSPPGHGIMAIGTTCENVPLRDLCRNFLSKIDFIGLGGIEFKYYDGKYYFIEMNVRTEAIIPLTEKKYSLSLATYLGCIGCSIKNNENSYKINYLDIRPTVVARIRQRKPFFLIKDILIAFLFRNWKINIFYSNDIMPFVITFLRSVKGFIKNKFLGK